MIPVVSLPPVTVVPFGCDEETCTYCAPFLPEKPLLSPRQQQVLDLMAAGLSYERAAERLGISTPRYNKLTRIVRRKLGARNTAHAVALGHTHGLLRKETR